MVSSRLTAWTVRPVRHIVIPAQESSKLSALVELFVDWLYTGCVLRKALEWVSAAERPACDIHAPGESEKERAAQDAFCITMTMQRIKTYVFGDCFMCKSFKEAVLRSIMEDTYLTLSTYNAIIYAFTNLPESDPLLCNLVDQYCRNFRMDADAEADILKRNQLPRAFLIRVMLWYSGIVADVEQRPLRAKDYLTVSETVIKQVRFDSSSDKPDGRYLAKSYNFVFKTKDLQSYSKMGSVQAYVARSNTYQYCTNLVSTTGGGIPLRLLERCRAGAKHRLVE